MSKKGTLTVKVLGDTGGFDKAIGGLGKKAGVAFASAGVAAGGFAAFSVKAFADFDEAITNSLSIMTDVSDETRDRMSQTARDVAKTTKFSAVEAAESYYFLASAGMSAEQQLAALPAVAAFAQAGNFDMALATDLATDALSALGLAVDDPVENLANLERVMDVTARASQLANASIEQFSTSLTNKAAVSLRSVNKDVEEGVALLALWADRGVKGEAAGTMLSTMLGQLPRVAEANAEAFAKLNIEVFDADGNLKNLADISEDFTKALGPMSDAQRAAAFDQLGLNKQAKDAILLTMDGADALREYEKELREAGGTTQSVADKQMQTFNAQMGLLKDQFMDIAIQVGSWIVPRILAGVERLREGFAVLSAWWDVNGPGIMARVEAVREAISVFADRVKGAIGTVVTAWQEDGLTGALTALAGEIRSAWDDLFFPALQELGGNMGTWFGDLWENHVKPGWEDFKGDFERGWARIWDDWGDGQVDARGEAMSGWEIFWADFRAGWEILSTWITDWWNGIDWAQFGKDAGVELLRALWDALSFVGVGVDWLLVKFGEFGRKLARATWEGFQDALRGTIIGDLTGSGNSLLNEVLEDRHGSNGLNQDFMGPQYPGHNASGTGHWRGGPTWVGERGPELLNLPKGSRITSAPQSQWATEGSGQDITFVINPSPGMDERGLAEYTARFAGMQLATSGVAR